ncbi:hypothetical protein SP15_118 [Bacillus phage SP-15]|uniref:Uncharacterized protein n=1 Tax=Bacillus phage SP-15 TaxID=1792032 RepID=A0A127AW41_9CAUD|nr:hypothetical protein SP15_118 [Bacillus phage SP-15]AMM44916.1 hypothetical protein SP15_118 [Bacillus phage SP-15]
MKIYEIYRIENDGTMKFMMYTKSDSRSELYKFIKNEKVIFPDSHKYKIVESSDDILDISKPYEYVRGCPRHRIPTPEENCPICDGKGELMIRNIG